jgi:hypothetical protein
VLGSTGGSDDSHPVFVEGGVGRSSNSSPARHEDRYRGAQAFVRLMTHCVVRLRSGVVLAGAGLAGYPQEVTLAFSDECTRARCASTVRSGVQPSAAIESLEPHYAVRSRGNEQRPHPRKSVKAGAREDA